MDWLLAHEAELRCAPELSWPRLQRIRVHPWINDLIAMSRAIALAIEGQDSAIAYAEQKLQLPATELNPTPLINGNDLNIGWTNDYGEGGRVVITSDTGWPEGLRF